MYQNFRRHPVRAAAVIVGLVVAAAVPVWSATFVVDSLNDQTDQVAGDGQCSTAGGECTVRAAIDESNALAGPDVIGLPAGIFQIVGAPLVITDDLVVNGAGKFATDIRGRTQSSVLGISGNVSVTLRDLLIQGGRAPRGGGIDNPSGNLTAERVLLKFNRARLGHGGAIFNGGNAYLDEVSILGNVARSGGGIYNAAGASLTVSDTTMRRNRHRISGGGGCVFNAGDASVERSLLARCQGRIGSGGGGIYNSGTLGLVNSTIWGSRARLSQGGAIVNDAGGNLSILNSTIVRNQSAFVSAGIVNYGAASVENSILWGNFSRTHDANCGGPIPVLSLGYNLEGGWGCGFAASGDINGTNPNIGRDAHNGGPTHTRELRPGSPAVDTGIGPDCPPVDQRGEARPRDGDGDGVMGCDIGAYELDDAPRAAAPSSIPVPTLPAMAGPEFRANSFTPADQHAPAVATLPGGHFVVVWESSAAQDGDGTGIFARIHDDRGAPVGGEFAVNRLAAGDQSSAAVAADAAGNFVVAWESFAPLSNTQSIVARRFAADGQPLSDEVRVDDGQAPIASTPAVTLDANGQILVTWVSGEADSARIALRRLDANAAPIANVELVDGGSEGEPSSPAIAAGPTRALLVWSVDGADVPALRGRWLDTSGTAGNPFTIWQPLTDAADVPDAAVAADGTGRFVVTWHAPDIGSADERDTILAQRFNADGTPLGSMLRASLDRPGYRARPRVAMSPGGHFLVVWESETEDDTSGASVIARRFDENGKAVGDELRVSVAVEAFQIEPSVAVHPNGSFQVVWASDATDGDGFGVYGHTTALDGFVGFKAKETSRDGNQLPDEWTLVLDDLVLANDSGDDPENYTAGSTRQILNPILRPDSPSGPSYVAYAVTRAAQSVGNPTSKASKRRPRLWEIDNRFGTLVLQSKQATTLWMPTQLEGDPEPSPAAAPAYLCYGVKPVADSGASQTTGGKLRRDLQVFARDRFDDCSHPDRPGFPGTAVSNQCLYELKAPAELCNPVALSPVQEPRKSSVSQIPVTAATGPTLLCYHAQRATSVDSADAALLIGQRGQLSPAQAKHARHKMRDGSGLSLATEFGFPAPFELDTVKTSSVCLPTRVRDVSLVD